MEYGPPPLFNQGLSSRARLSFFAFASIALLVVDARVKALDTLRVGVGVVLYPIQQTLLVPREMAERVGDYFTSVAALRRENEALKVTALEQAQRAQRTADLEAENAQLRRLLSASARFDQTPVLAQIQFEERDRYARRLVIDRGERAGVRGGSPVIDELGVVGQVTRLYPSQAEVTLITDRDQSIPVQVLRNGLRGVAYGGAEVGTLDLRFLPINADVQNNDVITTSGIDGVFPPGLQVATVARVERDANDQFARIILKPVAGVQNHRHLLVLQSAAPPLGPPNAPPAETGKAPRVELRRGQRK